MDRIARAAMATSGGADETSKLRGEDTRTFLNFATGKDRSGIFPLFGDPTLAGTQVCRRLRSVAETGQPTPPLPRSFSAVEQTVFTRFGVVSSLRLEELSFQKPVEEYHNALCGGEGRCNSKHRQTYKRESIDRSDQATAEKGKVTCK